jgi:hypothetical protein
MISAPVCPIIVASYEVYGATNSKPEAVPGLFTFIVTFMGCKVGAETKFHTCELELLVDVCDDLKLSTPTIISYYRYYGNF